LKGHFRYRILFLLIFIIAGIVRTTSLTLRPMHTDEAVHALKFADLIENGSYKYDTFDYHGPTLNYFTLIPAWIRSQNNLAEIDEITLRIVPVLFGLGIILLLLLLVGVSGWPDILKLTLLIAVSPALVFYSRYYIQEILLLFFNFGFIVSVFRYICSKKTVWVIAAGIFAGLMSATKETWILFILIQMVAFLIILLIKDSGTTIRQVLKLLKSWHFYLLIFIAGIIYVLFFSSFFTNPGGIADSILTYQGYFSRGGGQSVHKHPWWFYLQVIAGRSCYLNFFRADFWLLLGGIAGFIRLLAEKRKQDPAWLFYLFMGISTILSGVFLSILPYKTPWNILAIYPGLIFLTTYAISSVKNTKTRAIVSIISIIAVIHLSYQVYSDNFKDYSNPCNSFVYAHPTNDIYTISNEVHKIVKAMPGENSFFTDIIIKNHEYWPLPWYLRDLPQIGWSDKIGFDKPSAPLILTTSPNPDLIKKLFELPPPGERFLYIPAFNNDLELRPGLLVNLYLRKDFWDIYIASQSAEENNGQ
jgi:uncharacterized protein (TIGR03663 family)